MMEMRLLFKHYPQIRRVSSFTVYAFKVSTFLQSSVIRPIRFRIFHDLAQLAKRKISSYLDASTSILKSFFTEPGANLTPNVFYKKRKK